MGSSNRPTLQQLSWGQVAWLAVPPTTEVLRCNTRPGGMIQGSPQHVWKPTLPPAIHCGYWSLCPACPLLLPMATSQPLLRPVFPGGQGTGSSCCSTDWVLPAPGELLQKPHCFKNLWAAYLSINGLKKNDSRAFSRVAVLTFGHVSSLWLPGHLLQSVRSKL